MAINFPNNRDQLDPPQPSGPLQDGDAFTDAGQTWTWNSGLGVWSTDTSGGGGGGADLDALYLSKVNDDTARGEITFEGQTTHEAGISVTNGRIVSEGSSEVQQFVLCKAVRKMLIQASGQLLQQGHQPPE